MRRIGLILLAATGLAGCGLREPLQPPPGASLPVAPATARARPDAAGLLAQQPITRPARVDEIVRRSELRDEDRFDLPPPEVPAGAVPIPVDSGGPQGSGPER